MQLCRRSQRNANYSRMPMSLQMDPRRMASMDDCAAKCGVLGMHTPVAPIATPFFPAVLSFSKSQPKTAGEGEGETSSP